MADKPILFSAPMVRALLEGRKTQMRRVLKQARVFATPESRAFTIRGDNLARALQGADRFRHLGGQGWFWEADAFHYQAPATRTGWMAHIGFATGDRLWVREAWRTNAMWDHLSPRQLAEESEQYGRVSVLFEAGGALPGSVAVKDAGRIRPSMHMPRWASRLTLLVTDVRVERLQDISEADAIAEGVPDFSQIDASHAEASARLDWPRRQYAALWNSINGPGAWDENPWVVAVSFDVRRGNIDD